MVKALYALLFLTGIFSGVLPTVSCAEDILNATLAETGQKTNEVSTGELRQLLKDGSAIILDTRTRAEFDAGHIPGAVVLDAAPDAQVAETNRLAGGNLSTAFVLYCNGPFCQASRRLADRLVQAGFSNIRRYQLGIPIWRALGGPTAAELSGIQRVFGKDATAVFVDARSEAEFARGSLPGAKSMPAENVVSGKLTKLNLPEDDFNRKVVLFGKDGAQARVLAELLSKRPWHNVVYYSGTYDTLISTVQGK